MSTENNTNNNTEGILTVEFESQVSSLLYYLKNAKDVDGFVTLEECEHVVDRYIAGFNEHMYNIESKDEVGHQIRLASCSKLSPIYQQAKESKEDYIPFYNKEVEVSVQGIITTVGYLFIGAYSDEYKTQINFDTQQYKDDQSEVTLELDFMQDKEGKSDIRFNNTPATFDEAISLFRAEASANYVKDWESE